MGFVERSDEVGKVFFLDHVGCVLQIEPRARPLVRLLPVIELVADREWRDIDIHHERSAGLAALAIAIRTERDRADRAAHGCFLLSLARGRDMRGSAVRLVSGRGS